MSQSKLTSERISKVEAILENHFPEFEMNTYRDNWVRDIRCWREIRSSFELDSEEISELIIRDKIIRMLEDLKKEIDSDIERIQSRSESKENNNE